MKEGAVESIEADARVSPEQVTANGENRVVVEAAGQAVDLQSVPAVQRYGDRALTADKRFVVLRTPSDTGVAVQAVHRRRTTRRRSGERGKISCLAADRQHQC